MVKMDGTTKIKRLISRHLHPSNRFSHLRLGVLGENTIRYLEGKNGIPLSELKSILDHAIPSDTPPQIYIDTLAHMSIVSMSVEGLAESVRMHVHHGNTCMLGNLVDMGIINDEDAGRSATQVVIMMFVLSLYMYKKSKKGENCIGEYAFAFKYLDTCMNQFILQDGDKYGDMWGAMLFDNKLLTLITDTIITLYGTYAACLEHPGRSLESFNGGILYPRDTLKQMFSENKAIMFILPISKV